MAMETDTITLPAAWASALVSMTKAELVAALDAERRRSSELALALQLLACHAQDASGNLPPMHAADLQHITRHLPSLVKPERVADWAEGERRDWGQGPMVFRNGEWRRDT